MASQLQLRRGTTAQHAVFTGAPGEVTVDTDKNTVVVHDGSTPGGFPGSVADVTATGSTTPRFLGDRFADVINVKDFGAVGNGIADDAPAIRAAMNYAITKSSSTVYFPSGIYNLGTYSDGTSTHSGTGQKEIWSSQQGNTQMKSIALIGDKQAILRSGLYPSSTARLNDNRAAGQLIWFYFGANYNVTVWGIVFKRLIGGNHSPISALPTDGTVLFGTTFAVVVGYEYNQIDPGVRVEIGHCEFYEFTRDIAVQLNSASAQSIVGHCDIHHNYFYSQWGCCSTSTDDSVSSVNANTVAATERFTDNVCIGGPNDFSGIINTQVGTYQRFKCKDGSVNSNCKKSVITGNHVKNMSVEGIIYTGYYNGYKWSESHAIISNNILDMTQPILHNAWYPDGVVFVGPNGIVSDNVIIGARYGIFTQTPTVNVIYKNNVIEMYSSTTRSFDFTAGIFVSPSNNAVNARAIASITSNGTTATVTTVAPHYLDTGDTVNIENSSVGGYNGRFDRVVVTGANTFTYQIAGSLASANGGVFRPWSQYYEISNNSIICRNANPDDNTWDGTPGGFNPTTMRMSAAILAGGPSFKRGIIKGNYMKLCGKQNPARKLAALQLSRQLIVKDNVSDGFDYLLATTGTTQQTPRLMENNEMLDGERLDACLVSTGPESLYQDGMLEFAPSAIGWYELVGIQNIPLNVELEILVEQYFDGAEFQFNIAGNDRYQHTKISLARGGYYNEGGTGSPNPDHVSITQQHVDLGSPLISKVAFRTDFSPRLFLWVSAVSGKPNKAVIKSESFRVAGGGGSVVRIAFAGATDNDAFGAVDALTTKIEFQRGVVNYLRQGNNTNSGALTLVGSGRPLIGTAAPAFTPSFIGQQFIRTDNGKVYVAKGASSSSDWEILN